MPRIRYLKPDFFKDEDLAILPFEIRLFFAGLWNFADKSGRLEDRPLRLKAEIFPYDKVDVEKCLQQLNTPKNGSGTPFIQRYIIDNQKYIQIINWNKHQKPHHTEQDSKIPPPPPLTTPLTIKGTEKGTENKDDPSVKLRNGVSTDKERLNIKERYLDHVLLTKDEYKKLIDRFGQIGATSYIEKLNNYIGSKGKQYKSHYHTILVWADKAKENDNGKNKHNIGQDNRQDKYAGIGKE